MIVWYQQRFFKNLFALVLILFAIYIGYSILPLIGAVIGFFLKILYPFFLSILFFYFLRPITHRMERRMPRWAAITILYIVVGIFIGFIAMFIYPIFTEQIRNLRAAKFENIIKIDQMRPEIYHIFGYEIHFPVQIRSILGNMLTEINYYLVDNLANFISAITQFFMFMTIVPFIVFFLLKDSRKIYEKICEMSPQSYKANIKDFLLDIDITLSYFISGRILIALITSAFLLVCFLAIGLDYAVILTVICMIFFTIPTLGAFIAMVPPILVGFSMSPTMGLVTIVLMLIASGLEGFVISPPIIEKQLFIHPLTIILVLLVGGELFGISGLLFGVPAYLLIKIFLKHGYKFMQEEEIVP